MTSAEWRRAAMLAAAVIALHVTGFGLLFLVVEPAHLEVGTGVFGVGLGLTAYMLGVRHAFDADHIGAIDNTTRKLMADGQRPLGTGFFFAMGHSTVVFLLAVGLALGLRGLGVAVADEESSLHRTAAILGPLVSGAFLVVIGMLNVFVLRNVVSVLGRQRLGRYDELEIERHLAQRGIMGRAFGRVAASVTASWQLYPIGLLFGLGFDTATEVALLATAGAAAADGLPVYAVICLPVLFAAGMTLLDTVDGAFMSVAYRWALAQPVRKLYYNLTITVLSIAVALVVGSIELLSVAAEPLGLDGPIWDTAVSADLNQVGWVASAIFVATWVVALATWRLGRLEERWGARVTLDAASEGERG